MIYTICIHLDDPLIRKNVSFVEKWKKKKFIFLFYLFFIGLYFACNLEFNYIAVSGVTEMGLSKSFMCGMS